MFVVILKTRLNSGIHFTVSAEDQCATADVSC